MTELSLAVDRWKSWSPAAGDGISSEPPALLRRRVTAAGRKALAAAWDLSPGDGAHLIFTSRHGEYERTLGLLTQLAAENAVSPAEFSLSVHSALAGLLSIATGNREGLTAIAAGRDSFGYGLLEAGACLAERPAQPVVLVHFDAPLPDLYAGTVDDDEEPLVAALSLSAPPPGAPRVVVAVEPGSPAQPSSPSLAGEFLAFLGGRERERRVRGNRMTWSWRRDG